MHSKAKNKNKPQIYVDEEILEEKHADSISHHIYAVPPPNFCVQEGDDDDVGISEDMLINMLDGDEASEFDMRSKIDQALSVTNDNNNSNSNSTKRGNGDENLRSGPSSIAKLNDNRQNFLVSEISENSIDAQQRLMCEMGTLKNYRNLNRFNDKVFRSTKSAPSDSREEALRSVSKSVNWITFFKITRKK